MKNKTQIIRLYDANKTVKQVIKVGIVPFIINDGKIQIMAMKPIAENEKLGKPQFQIAKGTRRININGNWCDMRADDLKFADESFYESLLDTALREGQEEIGLKPKNIKKIYDLGDFVFISASKGTKSPLHLFAAEIIDINDFSEFEESTEETKWLSPEEFTQLSRSDHSLIMNEIIEMLENAHNINK